MRHRQWRGGPDGLFHLTYCTKVHPGRGWPELFVIPVPWRHGSGPALPRSGPSVWACGSPPRESRELLAGDALARFQDFLAAQQLYVFTLNGFPYGDLGAQPVKEGIFAPDWRAPRRLDYTLRLVDILARLLPAGGEGGISTVPLSYKPWIAAGDAAALAAIIDNLGA